MKAKTTSVKTMGAVAVSAALLVPLAIFGAPALARSGAAAAAQYQYGSGSSEYQYRVTICHLTGSRKHPGHSITVSSHALSAHLRHGDHLGACTGLETPKKHGKGGEAKSNGKSGSDETEQAETHGNEHGNGHEQGHDKDHGK